LRALRFSDLYRNVSSYLKKNMCRDDFSGCRQWLEKWITNPHRVDTILVKIKSSGANCDCEVISKVKPELNGRTLLVVLEE